MNGYLLAGKDKKNKKNKKRLKTQAPSRVTEKRI